jgi:hypothetical protein
MLNVILWHVRVATVAMETQKQVCISVDVHVAVNNIKGFGVVTEREQVVPFALQSS